MVASAAAAAAAAAASGRTRDVSQGRRLGEGRVRDREAGEGKRAGKPVWGRGGEKERRSPERGGWEQGRRRSRGTQ